LKSRKKIKNKSVREIQVSLENRILLGAVMLIMLLGITLIDTNLVSMFTGFFVSEEGTITIDLNLSINQSFETNLTLDYMPTSIRLSGKMIGNGTANVYLDTPDALYLIFDEEYIMEKGTIEITALAIADLNESGNNTDEVEADEDSNLPDEMINATENIDETENINETESLINLTLEDENATLTNQSDENNPETSAVIIEFNQICRETCSLINVSKQIRLIVEVENATLNISSLTYTYEPMNLTNAAPELIKNISDIRIDKNQNYSIDLSEYYLDEDFDLLTYSATHIDNISVHITDSNATIVPDTGFIGTRYVQFAAFDNLNSTFSNNISIEVVDTANVSIIKNETTVQIFAVIGKPVRYVKRVVLNQSMANLTINISAKSSNITVTKIEDNVSIEIDKEKVTVILNETEKQLDNINEEDTLDEALITGAVVAVDGGQGILTRMIDALSNGGITGRAIGIPEEAVNISVELSTEDNAQLVINDTVSEVEIEYYTPGPEAFEENTTDMKKNVTIVSEIAYQNVLTYTDIVDVPEQLIKIYWYVNESDYNYYSGLPLIGVNNESLNLSDEKTFRLDITDKPEFYVSFYDTNNNSLIDNVQWITPHLSNQTFEIEITVLNVQSYPIIGGNWTVSFLTAGTANLSIIAVNMTTFTEEANDDEATPDDLQILRLMCGNNTLYERGSVYNENVTLILLNGTEINPLDAVGQDLMIQGIKIKDYNCKETGQHTVKVITEGVHNQMFVFGNYTAFANNLAQYAPVAEVIRFADGNLTASYYFINS